MAESDEWASVETVDDGVESVTHSQAGPGGVDQGIFEKIILTLFMINPWYILLLAASSYYLWQKLRPSFSRGRGNSDYYPIQDPAEVLARQEAQENARRRMQELYNQKAREHAIKQKEKEEQKRQEKLKNLEKYGTVLGRSGKTLAAAAEEELPEQTLPKKKVDKPKLRPEYNPLMGAGGGGACFRPTRRGGGAGGG